MVPAGRPIFYSEFKALVRGGQVAEVSVNDTSIRGTLKKAEHGSPAPAPPPTRFRRDGQARV